MESHKPRHWRGYLKEYAIIVVGVLTALGAQQAADWWRWQGEVRQARAVIATEMARNISFAIMRTRIVRCAEQRISDLGGILDAAAARGSLPPLGAVGGVLQTPWSTGAWDGVMASQAASHFSREQLAALSLVYRRVERIEAWNRQESETWTIIRSMEGMGRRLDPPYETELRKAINLASWLNGVITVSAVRMVQGALDENLPFTPDERRQMAEAMKYQSPAWNCGKVLSQPPPAYRSQGALSPANLAEMGAVEKRLPALVTPPAP